MEASQRDVRARDTRRVTRVARDAERLLQAHDRLVRTPERPEHPCQVSQRRDPLIEPEAMSVHGLDEPRLPGIVVQHPPDLADAHAERRVAHRDVGPDRLSTARPSTRAGQGA